MNYELGHVDPWWNDDFKSLEYVTYPLPNTHDLLRWINEGYRGLNFNGGVYDMRRHMPEYATPFFSLFDWQHVGISFYRMLTCDVLPTHRDTYEKYRKMHDIQDPDQIYRAIVFLEDWKSGHYFEIDEQPIMSWRRGDWVRWRYNTPHFAGNIGVEPRYTLQITGIQSHLPKELV
jgi:hypothetical protein